MTSLPNLPVQTIESGVPVPPPRRTRPTFLIDDLEVGQRLVVEGRTASQLAPSVAKARKRTPGREFTIRDLVPTDEDPRIGCAVWRTT